MFFVVMVHEMRVCFSKNAAVIKVVVDKNDRIPSNSQNPPEELEIEESHLVELRESRKIFASVLESYLENISWIYYLRNLNAKIVHLFLVNCKKVFPGNMNWLLIIFW